MGLAANVSSVSQSESCPPLAMIAWMSASESSSARPGISRRRRCRSRPRPAPRSSRSRLRGCQAHGVADAGVFGGYADSMSAATLRSAGAVLRSRAWRRRCRRRGRSVRGRAGTGRPFSSNSLNENGTVMIRPSNLGTATWVATSSGDRPSSLAAQSSREPVRHRPCRIGMSRAARRSMFQASSSPLADAAAGWIRPPRGR